MSVNAALLENKMSIIRDPDDQTRQLKISANGEITALTGSSSPALTYTETFNNSLTATYQKVATTSAATKSLRMSCASNATAYDIEYQVVVAGGAAPTANGMSLLAGEDFAVGIPIGDIYARSATNQRLIVWRS